MLNLFKPRVHVNSSGLYKNIIQKLHKFSHYFIFKEKEMTYEQWDAKLDKLFVKSHLRAISEVTDACYMTKNASLAKSFLEYVKVKNEEMLPVAKALTLKVLSIDKENRPMVLEIVEEFKQAQFNKRIWDIANGSERIHYQNPFKLLQELKRLPKSSKERTPDFMNSNRHSALTSFNDLNIMKSKEELKAMLVDKANGSTMLPEEAYDKILRYLQQNGLKHRITKILNDAPCSNCGVSLKKESISEEDIDDLKIAFEKDIVKGKNLLFSTFPEEWRKFEIFLEEAGKFDIIVDGLNFCVSPTNYEMLDFHKLEGLRYLFIGRNAAKRQIENLALSIGKEFRAFYVHPHSKDDRFLIYAALHSGYGTRIISGDFFRDHKKFTDPCHEKKLISWQHNFQVLPVEGKLLPCSQYKHVVHYDGVDTFHLPKTRIEVLGPEEYWLCFKL